MKILHTADWHIGQFLHEYDRSFEHQQFLNWLLNTLTKKCIDVLLISADAPTKSNTTPLINNEMHAIECLRNHGRKVGMILYVQEMTRWIQVQTKVIKERNGRSKVEAIDM